jgi:hypothetical protein
MTNLLRHGKPRTAPLRVTTLKPFSSRNERSNEGRQRHALARALHISAASLRGRKAIMMRQNLCITASVSQ